MSVKFPILGVANQVQRPEKPNLFTYLKIGARVRPAVAVLGFIMGSAAAITFALAGTVIVFAVLRSEHPRLDAEIAPLLGNTGLFLLLTLAAAASFYGEIKRRVWRHAALVTLLALIAIIVLYQSLP